MDIDLLQNMYVDDEKTKIVPGNALDALWQEGIIYEIPCKTSDGRNAVALAVNCNDLFWWGYADSEIFSYSDIKELYETCFDEKGNNLPYGSFKWACLRRKMRPQHDVENIMKLNFAWDDELDALPIREFTG